MPLTLIDVPILAQFLCVVHHSTGKPAMPDVTTLESSHDAVDSTPKKLPKGVVLGPDGKPCRSCTSFASWAAMTKKETADKSPSASTASSASATIASSLLGPPADCPPDVEALGRSSWSLLHTMAAQYPTNPTPQQQNDARSFVSSFSRLYPCYVCATDFQTWMKEDKNAPRVSNRKEFGQWMCEAHNEVNVKLGKSVFDCSKIEERWRSGWKDGRCDG